MQKQKEQELLQVLIKKSLLTEADLKKIEKESSEGQTLADFLLVRKIIGEEELTKAKAGVYGFPYEDLLDRKISDEILKTISEEVSQNYKIVCFDQVGRRWIFYLRERVILLNII